VGTKEVAGTRLVLGLNGHCLVVDFPPVPGTHFNQAGKLKLEGGPEDFLLSSIARYAVLPIDVEFRHVLRMLKLPALHRDPFDRLLIAQAQEENLPILTSDRFIRQYKVDVLW
jgi:PIN domain nuclease of toxin-antitoxin system